MDEWTEAMKDNHSEMEVKSQAAEESELVSRQRNVGGVSEGVEGIGVSMKREIMESRRMLKG